MALASLGRKLCWPARPDVRPFERAFRTQILDRPRIQEACHSILVNYETREIGASATRMSEWELPQIHGETS